MSLFQSNNFTITPQQSKNNQKRQKFREELRQIQRDRKITAVRKQLIHSLKSLKFLDAIKSDLNNLTYKHLPKLLECFQSGLSNAAFYQNVVNMNLEHYLCEFIKEYSRQLSIDQKSKILRSLVELTFYCYEGYRAIIQDELIDWIKLEIQNIICSNYQKTPELLNDQFQLVYQGATLAMNLSVASDRQFNYYLMQTDFINTILNYLDRKTRENSLTSDNQYFLRQSILKLFGNLFDPKIYKEEFIMRNIEMVITDENYLIGNSDGVFGCLHRISRCEKIWPLIINSRWYMDILLYISNGLRRSLQSNNFQAYSYLADFIINLFESQINCEADQIIKMFPQRAILIMMDQLMQESTHINIIQVGKWIKIIYYCMYDNYELFQGSNNTDYFSIIPTINDRNKLIEIVLCERNLYDIKFGKYSVSLIVEMLNFQPTIIDALANYGLMDRLPQLLTGGEYRTEITIESIDLIKKLIITDEKLKYKEQKNKMLEVLEARGIIFQIEKLQDYQSRAVYKKAEDFMSWIDDFRKNF